jgi:hypothetical protein
MTTEAEIQKLKEMGQDLAGAMQSPWEPGCVARAFADARSQIGLTMQGWINLDAARSPMLIGLPLETDEDLFAAAEAFEIDLDEMDEEDKALCSLGMERATREAFGMVLRMREPGATGTMSADGFGAWLPMMAFLLAECRMSYDVACRTFVGRAFALIAAVRRNQGWEVAGEAYAMREVAERSEIEDGTNDEEPEGLSRG